jgi:hypothetical protein
MGREVAAKPGRGVRMGRGESWRSKAAWMKGVWRNEEERNNRANKANNPIIRIYQMQRVLKRLPVF